MGFSFYNDKGTWAVRIAKNSVESIKAKSKKITGCSNGSNNDEKILKMTMHIKGWVNSFSIANAKRTMQQLDKCVRPRLRIGLATARSNKVATTLALQDFSQLKKDYGKEQADVIINITGNIICGQVIGETSKLLSERFGKVMQDRQSINTNPADIF